MQNIEKKIEDSNKNWINFISDVKKPDRIAVFIGFLLIFIISIGIVYIGTWQAAYANQFYHIKFKINFLEGIENGIKIRYQGGVTIGEVVMIESNYSEHYLYAKIKKDFKIIKSGTKVTLKSQGSFGSNYLDISTLPYYFSSEAYLPDEVIEVTDVEPFQATINNINDMFKTENSKESAIVIKLKGVKNMVYQLLINKDIFPKTIRLTVQNYTQEIQKGLLNFHEFNNTLFASTEKINVTLNNIANSLRKNLPVIKKTTDQIYSLVRYRPENAGKSKYMHDEQLYYTILIRLHLINNRLGDYKNYPYKLIFDSEL
ncbi:MAG: MCE family protein [Spirochaetia bacterium]|nr:MCE family protein [Spirochaetia bacterium]